MACMHLAFAFTFFVVSSAASCDHCDSHSGDLNGCNGCDNCIWSSYDSACISPFRPLPCPVEKYHHCSNYDPKCDATQVTCNSCSGDDTCAWVKEVKSLSGYLWACSADETKCPSDTVATVLAAAAPTQPHLAQAWTALSKGDGLPNTVGLEHYIYEDQKTAGGLQGHIWDYGDSCKKIELNTHGHYDKKTTSFASGTYYINCDAVDCCYAGKGAHPAIPDVKQWDIATQGPGGFSKVHFVGNEDTTELNDNPVKQAEHWMETDKMPFQPKGVNVSYHYYVTRSADGITSHRIDYSAPGAAPGSILYGNFTIIKNLTAHRNLFQIPDKCYPQGSGGRGHALACDGKMLKTWEQKHFKHSHAAAATSNVVV